GGWGGGGWGPRPLRGGRVAAPPVRDALGHALLHGGAHRRRLDLQARDRRLARARAARAVHSRCHPGEQLTRGGMCLVHLEPAPEHIVGIRHPSRLEITSRERVKRRGPRVPPPLLLESLQTPRVTRGRIRHPYLQPERTLTPDA